MRGGKRRVRKRDVNRPPPMMERCHSKRPRKGETPLRKTHDKITYKARARNLSKRDKQIDECLDYYETFKKGEEKKRKKKRK